MTVPTAGQNAVKAQVYSRTSFCDFMKTYVFTSTHLVLKSYWPRHKIPLLNTAPLKLPFPFLASTFFEGRETAQTTKASSHLSTLSNSQESGSLTDSWLTLLQADLEDTSKHSGAKNSEGLLAVREVRVISLTPGSGVWYVCDYRKCTSSSGQALPAPSKKELLRLKKILKIT